MPTSHAQTRELIRSNQTRYSIAFCDECKWDSQEIMGSQQMNAIDALALAAFHDECNHQDDVQEIPRDDDLYND